MSYREAEGREGIPSVEVMLPAEVPGFNHTNYLDQGEGRKKPLRLNGNFGRSLTSPALFRRSQPGLRCGVGGNSESVRALVLWRRMRGSRYLTIEVVAVEP
jgi:hypothetical protein